MAKTLFVILGFLFSSSIYAAQLPVTAQFVADMNSSKTISEAIQKLKSKLPAQEFADLLLKTKGIEQAQPPRLKLVGPDAIQ
jgi:hypothetical protein